MKTLQDEWYIVIKPYMFTIFEILRGFCITIYCVSTLSLHIVYQLHTSGIMLGINVVLWGRHPHFLQHRVYCELVKYPAVPDWPKVRYSK